MEREALASLLGNLWPVPGPSTPRELALSQVHIEAWFKTPGIRVTVLALLTGVGSCSGFCQSRSGGIS